MMITSKSYSELAALETFKERFNYLKLDGIVGQSTFGFERYLNQQFYRSREWMDFRRDIIVRDLGCDLGIEGFDIFKYATIHHINPVSIADIKTMSSKLFDPENAILTSANTHRAIHYSDESLLVTLPPERQANDTCPWK